MPSKSRGRKRIREVTREEIVARARSLGPWYLGSGLLLATLIAALCWYLRPGPDPLPAELAGLALVGVAVGLALAYLRAPDLGVRPGTHLDLPRDHGAAQPEAYQRALATFGQSWLWVGALWPVLALLIAEFLPLTSPINPLAIPSPGVDSLAVSIFLSLMNALATFSLAWGVKLLLVARTRLDQHSEPGLPDGRDRASSPR